MPTFLTTYIDPAKFTFGICEGEKDINLARCFVRTQSINIFINNIQTKNFVIAPKGLGKSGLCSMLTDCQNILLPNKQDYFYMNSIHCEQTVEFCSDIKKLKYNLISHFCNTIITHLLNAYDDGIASPITKLKEFMSKQLTLESVTAKGSLTIGALIADVTGKWINTESEIDKTYAEIFEYIEDVLKYKKKRIILCIDNLDDITKRMDIEQRKQVLCAFYDSIQLIRKWGDSINPVVLPVLFVRDDLFRYIDRRGESDKRSSIAELSWNLNEITRFTVKRFLANDLLNDIRKEIKIMFLKQGKIKSFFVNKRDLSWVDQLSSNQIAELFNVFFSLEIQNVTFYSWFTKALSDSNNVFNPRTIIDFFDLLLKYQYSDFEEKGKKEIHYENGQYQIFSEDIVLKAFHNLQQHKIEDCVDLISIGDKDKNQIKKIVEYVIIGLNKTSALNKLQYEKFGFSEKEFYTLIDEMEFYKMIKSHSGKPPYQKYDLSPMLLNYSESLVAGKM